MKTIKKEVIKEETYYELSEKEIEQIVTISRRDILNYIAFAIANYPYKFNSVTNVIKFYDDLCGFVTEESSTIRNKDGLSFWDYVSKKE